jgi:hypothetical protein
MDETILSITRTQAGLVLEGEARELDLPRRSQKICSGRLTMTSPALRSRSNASRAEADDLVEEHLDRRSGSAGCRWKPSGLARKCSSVSCRSSAHGAGLLMSICAGVSMSVDLFSAAVASVG